jgi:glycerol-3-phosphate dehydrogenase (NAD(P)+)
MCRVAVLGAGYMGSAITFPLADNGTDIHLWGTWLDDDILEASQRGEHPKLKKKLPEKVSLFYSQQLEEAVKEVDFILIAVSSEGFLPVFQKLLETLQTEQPLFTLTKGFVEYDGRIMRIHDAAFDLFKKKFPHENFIWTSVGGPVKAIELSNKVPTGTVFGINSPRIQELLRYFKAEYYRVAVTDDIAGVELSSAFKNVYAIALGICDGLYGTMKGRLFHNFKALLFNQAIQEMAIIIEAAGGRRATVFDLAGLGDLYVTSSSGRNRRFGEYIGKYMRAEEAYDLMLREGEIAEGYKTMGLGGEFLKGFGDNLLEKLPLFRTLDRILFLDKDVSVEMEGFFRRYILR